MKETKICKYCREEINKKAKVCPHCHKTLSMTWAQWIIGLLIGWFVLNLVYSMLG